MAFPKLERHPWKTWFAKSKFVLHQGEHFDCQTHSMVAQIRSAARKHHVSVSIQVSEGTSIQVTIKKRSHVVANRKK